LQRGMTRLLVVADRSPPRRLADAVMGRHNSANLSQVRWSHAVQTLVCHSKKYASRCSSAERCGSGILVP